MVAVIYFEKINKRTWNDNFGPQESKEIRVKSSQWTYLTKTKISGCKVMIR